MIGGPEAAFKAAVYSARRKPLPQESTGEIELGVQLDIIAPRNDERRNRMTRNLKPGSWLIYKSDGDERERFWLGRAQPYHGWHGKCQWYNISDQMVETKEH